MKKKSRVIVGSHLGAIVDPGLRETPHVLKTQKIVLGLHP